MRYNLLILFLFGCSFLFAEQFLDNIKENQLLSESETEYLEYLKENPMSYQYLTKSFLTNYFFLSDSLAKKIYLLAKNNKISDKSAVSKANIPIDVIKILKNYVNFSDEDNYQSYYISTKYKGNHLPYTFKYFYKKNYFKAGLILQNDEEEHDTFADYKSFYFLINRNKYKLIVGNYALDCGLFWSSQTGFNDPFYIKKDYYRLLYPNNSTYENFNLFGVAAQYQYKYYKIIPYFSSSKLTANLKDDEISSFDTSGIHTDKKDNVKEKIAGFLSYLPFKNTLWIFDYHIQNFDKNFADNNYKQKNHFANILFNFHDAHINFTSENSFNFHKIALLQSITLKNKSILHKISFRYFDDYFPMWHSNPYSHQTNNNNELGWLYSINFPIKKHLKINFYHDIYKQIKPQNEFLNKGVKNGFLSVYKHKQFKIRFKYIYIKKDEIISSVQTLTKNNSINLYFENAINSAFTLKTYFAFSDKYYELHYSKGFLIYQQIKAHFNQLKMVFRLTTTKTDIPIYVYEDNIRHIFQIANYNSDDFKFFIVVKKDIFKALHIEMKYENSLVKKDKNAFYFMISGKL